MKSNLSVNINELLFTHTAHPAGLKKILFAGADCDSNITQLAYGKLAAGETIPAHRHPTMEEFFYFLSGEGNYDIEGNVTVIKAGIAVRVPAGSHHTLSAKETLEFLFFGIAT